MRDHSIHITHRPRCAPILLIAVVSGCHSDFGRLNTDAGILPAGAIEIDGIILNRKPSFYRLLTHAKPCDVTVCVEAYDIDNNQILFTWLTGIALSASKTAPRISGTIEVEGEHEIWQQCSRFSGPNGFFLGSEIVISDAIDGQEITSLLGSGKSEIVIQIPPIELSCAK